MLWTLNKRIRCVLKTCHNQLIKPAEHRGSADWLLDGNGKR